MPSRKPNSKHEALCPSCGSIFCKAMPNEPWIEADLGENGDGVVSFDSPDDVDAFAAAEESAWGWIKPSDGAHAETIRTNLKQFCKGLQRATNTIRQSDVDPPPLEDLKVLLDSYATRPLIRSTTTRGKYVLAMHEKHDALIGSFAYAYFTQVFAPLDTVASKRGFALGVMFDAGIAPGMEAVVTERLAEIEQTAADQIEAMKRNAHEATERLEGNDLRWAKTLDEKSDLTNKLIIEGKAEFKAAMHGALTELTNIAKTYDEKLALDSAVSYWKKKGFSHAWRSWVYAGLFVVLVIAGIAAWVNVLPDLFDLAEIPADAQQSGEAADDSPDVTSESFADKILRGTPWWRVASTILFVSIWIWILRIIARQYLSHVHLGSDAEERSVMMTVYLAMLRRGQLPEGEDLSLILDTLFRHSPAGIIHDDASPRTPLDAVASVFTRK